MMQFQSSSYGDFAALNPTVTAPREGADAAKKKAKRRAKIKKYAKKKGISFKAAAAELKKKRAQGGMNRPGSMSRPGGGKNISPEDMQLPEHAADFDPDELDIEEIDIEEDEGMSPLVLVGIAAVVGGGLFLWMRR
jgi:hypothetical protein